LRDPQVQIALKYQQILKYQKYRWIQQNHLFPLTQRSLTILVFLKILKTPRFLSIRTILMFQIVQKNQRIRKNQLIRMYPHFPMFLQNQMCLHFPMFLQIRKTQRIPMIQLYLKNLPLFARQYRQIYKSAWLQMNRG
jgi:hypothetical protein